MKQIMLTRFFSDTWEIALTSSSMYQDAFQYHPQPMWVYEMKSLRFLKVNKAAVHSYGWSEDEFLRMTIYDIRPASEHKSLNKLIQKTHSRGEDNHSNVIHMNKAGAILYVDIHSRVVEFHGEEAVLVIANNK
jgi:PAS domain S-box-containing protein